MITAFAPGSISNLNCGFDILGCAIKDFGDEVSIDFASQDSFTVLGNEWLAAQDYKENLAYKVIQLFQSAIGKKDALAITLHKNMPISSGLGSSSASIVAALMAVNALYDRPLTKLQLLDLAIQGENIASGSAHADNAAPCMLGGMVLVHSMNPLSIVTLPHLDIHFVITHPHVEVPTKLARQILPERVPISIMVKQSAHLATFISSVYENNFDLMKSALHDYIIEPHRSLLIPYFHELKDIHSSAIGFGISGSGPSVFAMYQSASDAELALKEVTRHLENKIDHHSFVAAIDTHGASIISSK
jgi:homoserine kinase